MDDLIVGFDKPELCQISRRTMCAICCWTACSYGVGVVCESSRAHEKATASGLIYETPNISLYSTVSAPWNSRPFSTLWGHDEGAEGEGAEPNMLYDVSYLLGGSEKGIERRFIHSVNLRSDQAGPRARRKRVFFAGELRKRRRGIGGGW